MAEPLFGSVPQLWPAIPVPGLGYFQPLPASRVLAGGAAGGLSPQIETGQPTGGWSAPASMPLGSVPSLGVPSLGSLPPFGIPSLGSLPPLGGIPMFAAAEFATGITPQALLAAVAMRRGQPLGPTSDQEIEDVISDALDLLPGANDVEVRCEGGKATLTGSVSHKRLKRDAGEIVWAIPSVNDVQNNITIAARRRARSSARETEAPAATGTGRKQA